MTLGERIARLRRERDWTQDQFAEKVGVHSRHVSRWETDKNRPSARTLEKIGEVFGMDWETLVAQKSTGPEQVLRHEELLRQFQEVQELEEEDQVTIRRVIDAFVTKKRIEKVLHR